MRLIPYETEATLINAKGEPVFAIIFWNIRETPKDSYCPWLNILTYKWASSPIIESVDAYDINDKPYTITPEDQELWANSIQWEVSEHFKRVA